MIKITFEDPNDQPNPGAVRTFADAAYVCCTDHGAHPVADVQAGWKIRRQAEPWLTVLTVEVE